MHNLKWFIVLEKKKIVLLFLLAFFSTSADAYDVEVDGIYYNLIEKAKEAEVTYLNTSYNSYAGVVNIPSSILHEGETYYVTGIGNRAFYNCQNMTSVTIGDCVRSIGDEAFCGCYGISSIIIPSCVTSIGEDAFNSCSHLTSVHIFDLVAWCQVSFADSNSNPLKYAHHLFLNDKEVKDLVIPNSVKSIGSFVFYGCYNLTSVSIPINVISIGENAFRYCSGLTSVTIPSSVTNISESTFRDCSGLIPVIIGSSVNSIGGYAFSNCSNLTSVTIPSSVNSIGYEAFSGCYSLTTLIIGSGVKSISSNAFLSCKNINDVSCLAENVPKTSSDAFKDSYIDYATLYVPESSISKYSVVSPWNGFKEIKSLSGEIPEVKQCSKPTINYENGKIKCTCETEDVTYAYTITPLSFSGESITGEISLGLTFKISVYAQCEGYLDSEVATTTISLADVGDMNGDGRLSVEDVTKLVDVIMKKE